MRQKSPQFDAGRRSLWRARLVVCLLGASVTFGCRTFCPKSLEKDVVNARQTSLQGMDAMQQGRWDEAETIFAGAVKCCPSDERARGCYAETLWRRGACDQAVLNMQQAVELSGNDPQRLVQLGEMHLALGQLDQAAERTRCAIAKNCRLSTAWALQGDVNMARGKLDEALADYHRSIAYAEHQPRVQLAIAEIYERQGRPQRALSTLEGLAEQFPPGEVPVEVIAKQGFSLKKLGRYEDATEMLARAAQQGNPNADLLFQLAETQYLSGDASSAQLTLAATLAQNPQHASGLALKSQLEEKQQSLTARLPSSMMR